MAAITSSTAAPTHSHGDVPLLEAGSPLMVVGVVDVPAVVDVVVFSVVVVVALVVVVVDAWVVVVVGAAVVVVVGAAVVVVDPPEVVLVVELTAAEVFGLPLVVVLAAVVVVVAFPVVVVESAVVVVVEGSVGRLTLPEPDPHAATVRVARSAAPANAAPRILLSPAVLIPLPLTRSGGRSGIHSGRWRGLGGGPRTATGQIGLVAVTGP
jgi:hypothetical protein